MQLPHMYTSPIRLSAATGAALLQAKYCFSQLGLLAGAGAAAACLCAVSSVRLGLRPLLCMLRISGWLHCARLAAAT